MMTKCQNCGAPLAAGKEGETVRCTYCGAENRPQATVVQRVVMVVKGPADAAAGRRWTGIIVLLVVVLGIFGTVGVVLWRALTPFSSTVTYGPPERPAVTITTIKAAPGTMLQFGGGGMLPGGGGGAAYAPGGATVTEAEIQAGAKIARKDLATLLTPLLLELDPAGLAVDWSRFDPLAVLAWAQETARAWSADAVVAGVRAEKIRADGTGDYRQEAGGETAFLFASASLGKYQGLSVVFGGGKVRARSQAAMRVPAAGPAMSGACSMAGVMAALREQGLGATGTYRVMLEAAADGSWAWSATLAGKGRIAVGPGAGCQ
ncbi:MAG: hypothetical protein HY905_02890 [Deltaproteobacteria bacterium]|nr:hypothetical protein [Deltaproteobacteria bacterium]